MATSAATKDTGSRLGALAYFLAGCVFATIVAVISTALIQEAFLEDEASNVATPLTALLETDSNVISENNQLALSSAFKAEDSNEADETIAAQPSELERAQKRQITLFEDSITLYDLAIILSEQLGISVAVDEQIESDTTSLLLTNVSAKKAVTTAFKDYDVFLFLTQDDHGEALKKVWVYPKNSALAFRPAPTAAWASIEELEAQLEDSDPNTRAMAVGALIDRKGARAIDTIAQVFDDESEQVRAQAISALIDSGINLPLNLIEHIILSDPSRGIRMQALSMLENINDTEQTALNTVAELALHDIDEDVRRYAQEVLLTLRYLEELPEEQLEDEFVPPDV